MISGTDPRSLNAKMILNPIGIHSPKINDPAYCPADVKQEVMDYIKTYIY
jgi:hypothetical protein